MSPITTHVLDTALGKPAAGIQITLEKLNGDDWQTLASGITNADGRVANLLAEGSLEPGTYKMTFYTERYCKTVGFDTFYPYVPVIFEIENVDQHYHVPLLLSPFGYSTYRGS
ncbi:MAG: hydroxyisourate hydrolase [Anaerolineae bacterium]